MAVLAQPAAPASTVAYLWPCNVGTWQHWTAVQTQWRVGGMGSATGLDYAGVRAYLDEFALSGQDRRDVWAGICAAERGALDGWASKKKD